MKLKKYLPLLLSAALILSLLAGCGASSQKTAAVTYAGNGQPAMEAMGAPAEAPAAKDETGLTTGNSTNSTAVPENRKWIITVHMSAETEDLDALTKSLDEKIRSLGGYVEGQTVHNGSAYRGSRYRYANLTIRIPAADVDKFTQEVSGIANVVNQEKNLEDVTLSYVATESRVKALETEQTRLMELLAKAENMADLLEIEARLTQVRYELENYASRLRLYDNQIDYATIYLNIDEVQEYTPVAEPTLWQRISGGFADSLKDLGDGAQDLLVWLIVSLPFLAVYGVILVLILLLARKLRKRRREKKAEKLQRVRLEEDVPPEDAKE